ncbi:unnamed protein product [Brachionus calyciflorus]|uniref:Uncharacterized protein n=1 Tax=Brachionus calyciflorus TaxID=104777 RepID=A0A813M6Y9_9BILA|nr:unnamed protein product [Brachionus calyciflorus]
MQRLEPKFLWVLGLGWLLFYTSLFVTLFPDRWTSLNNTEFLGLGAQLTGVLLNKEVLILGMIDLIGEHSAENIQQAIETIVNEYDFDKSKIKGTVCDEGSSLVRLFGQLFFDENLPIDLDSSVIEEVIGDNTELVQEPCKSNFEVEFSNVQMEVTEITNEINSLTFTSNISFDVKNESSIEEIELDFERFYDLNKGQPINNLTLKIGSNELPRFSCSCHKLNLAVRHAMESHITICNIIRRINNSNSHIRRSINLNRSFRIKKCRLRLENLTRWGSAYMMLDSVKKAYSENLFDENNPDLNYSLEVLKPAYILNISFQNNHSSISDTLIGPKRLANILIRTISNKFAFELNSQIFQAAAVVKVSGIKIWVGQSWCENLFTKGIEALKVIGPVLLKKRLSEDQGDILNSDNQDEAGEDHPETPSDVFFSGFFSKEHERPINLLEEELLSQQITEEICQFKALLTANSCKLIFSTKNTTKFWHKHLEIFPKL